MGSEDTSSLASQHDSDPILHLRMHCAHVVSFLGSPSFLETNGIGMW